MTFYISRFKNMDSVEFDLEVVTPMFLGGADPTKAELRVPSIKAAMRFWWRTLYNGNDIKNMAKKEAEIFGSVANRAVVTVKLDSQSIKTVLKDLPPSNKIMVTSKGKTFPISIIEYLVFGLFDPKRKTGKYLREYIEPKSRFKVIVAFPKNKESEVNKSLKCMISFGGLGSRSRNGLGSLHCSALIDHTVKNEGDLKSFTAFSKEAKLFDKFNKHAKWEDALSEIGTVYRAARLNLEDRHKFNKRGLIAMPIESKFERNIPQSIRNGRHAKPYFLHVNKTTGGQYQGQILFLPYQYRAKPDDHSSKVDEYKAVCNKMNDEISKSMGGVK